MHRLAGEHRQLQVGIIGAGYVGRGLAHLLERLDGFRAAVVVNRTIERGIDAYRFAGCDPSEVVVARNETMLRDAIAAGRSVVVADPDLAIAVDELDVLVEATGSVDHGAQVMLAALQKGRKVVSINAEVDAAIGWLLHLTAARRGGVYTICDGDQPGVLMRTIDRVEHMGFDVLAAVNCKRHLDVHQSSVASAAYAARDATSVSIAVAAGDGTKMNLEQAVVANLTGLPPACRGMHGVRTTQKHALRDMRALLDAIGRNSIVEYTLGGDFGAGVFVIARAPEPAAVQTALRFFKLGDGPEYLIFSPYTLVHFEMPRSIAEVALDGDPLWSPATPPIAGVVAVAKRDLAPGDRLEGIGGDDCYGQIDCVGELAGLLPVVLAEHARVVKPLQRDESISLDAVEIDDDAPIVRLCREQDDLYRSSDRQV